MKNLQTAFSPRQYMLSKDYEIYYYSDNTLNSIQSHAHDYYEFYFFLNGEIELEINGRIFYPKVGDMALIPPGVPHYGRILNHETPYQRFIFWISQEYCNHLVSVSGDYGFIMQHTIITREYLHHFDSHVFNSIQSRIFALIEEMNSRKFGREAQLELYVSSIVLSLNRHLYEAINNKSASEPDDTCTRIMNFIQDNIDSRLTLDMIADRLYMSKYYIAHVFKENLGISIHQYIIKKRLAMARDALTGEENINIIYSKYGFNDYSGFYRSFKKEYGLSPKDYRAKYLIIKSEADK